MLDEVKGQEEGVRFLRRVVSGHLVSPLLLVGEEGRGRRFSVCQAVKETFCTGTRAAGCPCVDCTQVDQGVHPDFEVLTPEGDKDLGVDAIRGLVELAGQAPTMSPLRVLLVDGADRMTVAAANAILKTLEEPPKRTRFILLAESQDRVIPTIRSRCGLIPYPPLHEHLILSVLQRFEADPTKALVYVRMSEGSVGRAVRFWGSGKLGLRDKAFSFLTSMVGRDLPGLFSAIDGVEKELPLALRFLEQLLHDLLMLNLDPARMIHLDLAEALGTMRSKVVPAVWVRLSADLRDLQARARKTRLLLSFQVKSVFAHVALGV